MRRRRPCDNVRYAHGRTRIARAITSGRQRADSGQAALVMGPPSPCTRPANLRRSRKATTLPPELGPCMRPHGGGPVRGLASLRGQTAVPGWALPGTMMHPSHRYVAKGRAGSPRHARAERVPVGTQGSDRLPSARRCQTGPDSPCDRHEPDEATPSERRPPDSCA